MSESPPIPSAELVVLRAIGFVHAQDDECEDDDYNARWAALRYAVLTYEIEQDHAQRPPGTEEHANLDVVTLQGALRNFADDGAVRTHWDGCWRSHPKCAMMYAANVIDEYFNGL